MKKGNRVASGIEGLDTILKGGYLKNRTYLLKGGPGTGKTTLGLHFLEEGVVNNENCLFINLEESKKELINDAKNFNFNIDKIEILDLTPGGEYLKEKEYDVFSPSEVEQIPLIDKIRTKIKEMKPDRLVFDGLSNLYYLYESKYKLRKSIISLIQYLGEFNITSIFITEDSSGIDNILEYIASGVINLEFDGYERRLNIVKFRGSDHLKNFHTLNITNKGLNILPNLYYKKNVKDLGSEVLSSSVKEINKILNGGIEVSTNTIIIGPTGVGKTTLGLNIIRETVKSGKKAVVYLFEEAEMVLRKRCEGINMSLEELIANDNLLIKSVSSLEYNPIEFSNIVREDINNNDIDIVMFDSITGYNLSFAYNYYSKTDLLNHLHNLSNYLTNVGITVLMTDEMESITGDFESKEMGMSYLADNIIFLRYLEMDGKINKVIGVLKKRLSGFENTIREYKITTEGIKVGEPITNVIGILKNDIKILDNNK
jgi:circadian clock protein KaiC